MALPQDGQNANGLTKVTEIPKGKELIFIDPTTNEGGIITLEDLTTQILKNLTSQTFALDQGNMTLLAALNQLNSNLLFTRIASTDETNQTTINLSELEHGVYELYSTVGTYCTIGYSNGNWWLPVKSSENTTISGESLTFDAGSWYTIIYIRKIL